MNMTFVQIWQLILLHRLSFRFEMIYILVDANEKFRLRNVNG